MFETDGTQTDVELLLFLSKDILSTLCPQLLDTDGWDQLVQKVLLLHDDYDDTNCDSDIPIFQQEWEKQWEYSDEEEFSLEDVNRIVLYGRGRQAFSGNLQLDPYGPPDGSVVPDEFEDVEKDSEGAPDVEPEWHDPLDSIGCMDLVARACEMLADWVEENGEPVSRV